MLRKDRRARNFHRLNPESNGRDRLHASPQASPWPGLMFTFARKESGLTLSLVPAVTSGHVVLRLSRATVGYDLCRVWKDSLGSGRSKMQDER